MTGRLVIRRMLGALTLTMILAASCTVGDDTTGVTRISPSASSAPTPTRSPARPAPEDPVVETCTQRVGAIRALVKAGEGVSPAIATQIRAESERVAAALADVPLPGCERRETLVSVVPGAGAADFAARFRQVSASRGVITIHVEDWLRLSTTGRTLVLLHEWWHQVQQLSGWCAAEAGCRNEDLAGIPTWLFEADANLQSLRIGQRLGIVSAASEIQAWSGSSTRALAALRKDSPPGELSGDDVFWWYKMAQFAGYELVDGRPLRFLTFWRLAGRTGEWRSAFRSAFGVGYRSFFDDAFVGPDHLWA